MRKLLVLFLFLIPNIGSSQLVRVHGELGLTSLDGKIGQLTIFSLPDSSLKKGTYIDSTSFNAFFDKNGSTEFYAKFKILGFKDTMINFSVNDTVVDLGIIGLEKDLELETVEILYIQPNFQRTMDGIKVNVEGTTLQTLDNLFEILKASPKLTSPDDESIEIIGKGTPLILIDRQPIINVDELKAIPADMVESIEIITNPSAKYRAQGRGNGVIEIYTKNFRLQGYNMNISANGGVNTQGKPMGRLGMGISLKKGKFSMNAYLSGTYRSRISFGNSNDITLGDINQETSGAWEDNNWNIWQHGNIKAAYQIKDNHKITGGVRSGGSISATNGFSDRYYYLNDTLQTYRERNSESGYTWLNNSAFLNYIWETDTNKSNFEVNLNYRLRINESNTESYNAFTDQSTNSLSNFDVKNESRNRPNIGELRMTYEHIFDTSGWKLSAGGSFNMVYNRKRFDQFNLIDGAWEIDPLYTNSYDYNEQVGSVFIETTKNWGKVSVRAGLTGEYTNLSGYSNSLDKQFIDSVYILPFPSASIMYQPADKVSMTLRYSSGIDRPAFSNFDPFVRIQDSLSIEYGNPYLRPSIDHNVGFDLDLFYAYGISVDYSYSDQFESNLSFIDTNFLMNSTPWNADKSQSLSVSLNLPIQLKWLNGWNSFWFNYNKYEYTPIFERADFFNVTFGFWSYMNFILKNDWRITNRFHVSRWGNDQSINNTNVSWGLRVTKKFMDGNLSLWIEAQDIIAPVYRSEQFRSNYQGTSVSNWQFTTFKAGIWFKFGRLKQDTNIKESSSSQGNRI